MTNYADVIKHIETRIEAIREEIESNSNSNLLNQISQFTQAIKWLNIGQELNINPKATFLELPMTKTQTPSSEYRLIKDNESDDRNNWTEVSIEGKQIRPSIGDSLVISK